MEQEGEGEPWERALATQLLGRHLQVSFPPLDPAPDWLPAGKGWMSPQAQSELDLQARRRVVAVIGAGASRQALPVGDELVEELEHEIGVRHEADYELELTRLRRVYGLPLDFETHLVALCQRPEDERKVRDKISERFCLRHPSLLAYELIAHLLKHRYLDAVISFNFDELLDQSLDDELGRDEYVRVLSERDCRSVQRNPDSPQYAPLYIKMHGTASEPESLRFTRDAYYRTPKPIIELVESLLDTEHLVLVNVGCRLASFDFQYLLRGPRDISLFHIDPAPLDDVVRNAINGFRNDKETSRENKRASGEGEGNSGDDRRQVVPVHCGEGEKQLGNEFLPAMFERLMEALESAVKKKTGGLAQWRSVGRHRAAAGLLDTDRLPKHTVEHLRQRAVLEVAFAAAKGRGVVSTTSLIDERCGAYYELYADAARGKGLEPATWAMICAAGGLIESEDSSDVYYADQAICREDAPPVPCRTKPATNHVLRAVDPDRLAARALLEIDSHKWSPTQGLSAELGDQKRDLEEIIKELYDGDELEIHSLNDRVCAKVFVDPLILRTHTAFHALADKLLDGEDYDEIRVVAETGGWLADEDVSAKLQRLKRKRVKVITAFDLREGKLEEKLGLRVDQRLIPWWRHNRHMRLLCQGGQPVRALYYARLLRTSMVTPVFLDDGADLKRLELGWERLWQEAGEHTKRLAAREKREEKKQRQQQEKGEREQQRKTARGQQAQPAQSRKRQAASNRRKAH